MSRNYYNEFDPFAAEWLRILITMGYIPDGDVDTRSIEDVKPNDLSGYTQCHFFAGIGGWSYALKLAGWPDSEPVWTGSCPCQPFSSAGKGGGFTDERHLWPAFFHLISARKPSVIFGEQVASKEGLTWIDLVQTDLENASYSPVAFDLCAASVGAPHIRQRLFWMADSNNVGRGGRRASEASDESREIERSGGFRQVSGMEYSESNGLERRRSENSRGGNERVSTNGTFGGSRDRCSVIRSHEINSPWGNPDWIRCTDDKWRPIEPGSFPLAHGVSNRVGRLRGYGNAIVPQAAAEVIRAYMESRV